jgi:nitrogen regulatory protein P-II 1
MKKLEAIISPFKLDQVKAVLTSDGVRGVTISEVKGIGHEAGHVERYRGATYFIDWLPKIKLELLVQDEHADYLVRVIQSAAETVRNAVVSISIVPVEDAIRIRTGQRGHEAL